MRISLMWLLLIVAWYINIRAKLAGEDMMTGSALNVAVTILVIWLTYWLGK